jgi:hypothetical protein
LESDSKSTAIHAKILAPDFVNIYEFPNIPDYDNSRVVLVYPHEVIVFVGCSTWIFTTVLNFHRMPSAVRCLWNTSGKGFPLVPLKSGMV